MGLVFTSGIKSHKPSKKFHCSLSSLSLTFFFLTGWGPCKEFDTPLDHTARSRCRWSVSGGRACGTVCVYHEPVDGASERLAGASECSAARFSAAVADQNVLQPVVWQQADGHAQLAAGVIETELAAGEGVLGLARANRPRRHVAARRGVTNMMLLQHSFIWWLSQWDGAAALPS